MTYSPGDPRNALPRDNQVYSFHSGEKAGVRVGDPWVKADAALMRFSGMEAASWESGEFGEGVRREAGPVPTGRAFYWDKSWRRGLWVMDVGDGRVVAFSYNYVGPFFFYI